MIPLTTPGGLFIKWGHIVGWCEDILAMENGVATENVIRNGCADIFSPVAVPIVPTATPSGAGGTLASGTYTYRVSAVNGGRETHASPLVNAIVTGPTGKVTLTWEAVLNAESYKVYGRVAGSEGLLTTIATPTVTYDDTGSDSPGVAPPTSHAQEIIDDFTVRAGDAYLVDGLTNIVTNFRSAQISTKTSLQTLMNNTLLAMASKDAGGLTFSTLSDAMRYMVEQAGLNSESVYPNTVTIGTQAVYPTGSTPVGNPVIIMTALDEQGVEQEYIYDEEVIFRATTDVSTGATAGSEAFSVLGASSASSKVAYDWPVGSGAVGSMTAVDAALDNNGRNDLQNSSWDTWTNTNVPDNWTITVGAAGVQVLEGTSGQSFDSVDCLKIAGDGSTLTALTQKFSTTPDTGVGAGGTSYVILPRTQYAINLWAKVSSAAGAGVLEIALVNNGGTILTDDAGNQCKITKSLTTLTTSYEAVNGFIRTPSALPTATADLPVRLRVRLSTALTNLIDLYLDHLAMTPMTQLYTGGPFVAIFSGSTPVNASGATPDTWAIKANNDYASDWQMAMWRWFDMPTLGSQMPSSLSNTIADTLIV